MTVVSLSGNESDVGRCSLVSLVVVAKLVFSSSSLVDNLSPPSSSMYLTVGCNLRGRIIPPSSSTYLTAVAQVVPPLSM